MLSQKARPAAKTHKILCPNCGTPYSAEDQNCAACGDSLASNKTMATKNTRDLAAEE